MFGICLNVLIAFFTLAIIVFCSAALILFLKEEGFIKEREDK